MSRKDHSAASLSREIEAAASRRSSRKEEQKPSKYDYQVCLYIAPPKDISGDEFARLGLDYRTYKWRSKQQAGQKDMVEIRVDPRPDQLEGTDVRPLRELSAHSRMYILGHCAQGRDSIYPSEVDPDSHRVSELAQRMLKPGMAVHYKKLADLIASGVDKDSITPRDKRKLKISILACSAGAWTTQVHENPILLNNSFAARLSSDLETRHGIQVEVVARLVDIADDMKDPTQPPRMTFSESIPYKEDITIALHPDRKTLHTQPFNKVKLFKVIYTFEKDKQVMKPGYPGAHDWLDVYYMVFNDGYLAAKDPDQVLFLL